MRRAAENGRREAAFPSRRLCGATAASRRRALPFPSPTPCWYFALASSIQRPQRVYTARRVFCIVHAFLAVTSGDLIAVNRHCYQLIRAVGVHCNFRRTDVMRGVVCRPMRRRGSGGTKVTLIFLCHSNLGVVRPNPAPHQEKVPTTILDKIVNDYIRFNK